MPQLHHIHKSYNLKLETFFYHVFTANSTERHTPASKIPLSVIAIHDALKRDGHNAY